MYGYGFESLIYEGYVRQIRYTYTVSKGPDPVRIESGMARNHRTENLTTTGS